VRKSAAILVAFPPRDAAIDGRLLLRHPCQGRKKMILYHSPGACSLAVHIALEEVGTAFALERVMIADGENLEEPFTAINPRGHVPVLVEGGIVHRETSAILIYLASRFPTAGLLPGVESAGYSACLEWLSWIATTHHVNLMNYWRPHRLAPAGAPLDEMKAIAGKKFEDGGAEIEAAMIGPWFLGERYTVVDPYLLFCYRQGNRIGLPMASQFPKFTAWAHRMIARPAVARAFEKEGIDLAGNWPPVGLGQSPAAR
jgi:glutathione S-transferase